MRYHKLNHKETVEQQGETLLQLKEEEPTGEVGYLTPDIEQANFQYITLEEAQAAGLDVQQFVLPSIYDQTSDNQIWKFGNKPTVVFIELPLKLMPSKLQLYNLGTIQKLCNCCRVGTGIFKRRQSIIGGGKGCHQNITIQTSTILKK